MYDKKKWCWLLLVVSAMLYALPFLCGFYCWWLIFFFSTPLLYAACINNLSFIHGYAWAALTLLLHASGGISVLASLAHDYWMVGVLLGVCIVLYQSLVAGILFWSVTRIVIFFSVTSFVARLSLWTCVIWIFIVWVDRYSFWIFGVPEGYSLINPLIPLAHHPQLLYLLPIVGKPFLMLLVLCVGASCAGFLLYKNSRAVVVCGFFIMVCFFAGFFSVEKAERPEWVQRIHSLPYTVFSTASDPTVVIQLVAHELKRVLTQYPHKNIIIMPESALNCSTLFSDCNQIFAWSQQLLGKPVHFIFGSFREYEGNYYNTAYWMYDGKLCGCYDKRHVMLVTERLAWLGEYSLCKAIYNNGDREVTKSLYNRIIVNMSDDVACVPYICSELFFNEYPDDQHHNLSIMALVNDRAFITTKYSTYIQQLLVLLACCKAIEWQRNILYISYSQSLWIDKNGYQFRLDDFMGMEVGDDGN